MRASTGVFLIALLAGACDSLADGEVVVSLDSQGVAEMGLGGTGSGQPLADGWELSFSKVLVSIGDLEVAHTDGRVAARSSATYVVDLAAGAADIELLESLTAERWDAVSFSTRPPSDGPLKTFGATDEDAAMLVEGAYTHWIQGTATKEERTVAFAWGIGSPTAYEACTVGTDPEPGIAVAKGGSTPLALSLHLEHVFFDTLASEEGRLRFDAIAAVADVDGVVTWAALADQGLAALHDDNGDPLVDVNGPVLYDARDVVLARDDLQRFMLAGLQAAMHVGDEGRCTVSPL